MEPEPRPNGRVARIRLIFILAMAVRLAPALAEHAVRKHDGRWIEVAARTPADLSGFRPQAVKLSKYGGLASGPKMEATGFFYTKRLNGRWWLVDPEGCLFISVGLCSVNLSMFDDAAEKAAFDSRSAWAEATAKMLRTQGFNTLGRWSDANVGSANAGFLVKTQRHRGLFYTHHALSLLEDRNCVGWHWFKYGTHVNQSFEPHLDMTDLMKQVNEHVYRLAVHFTR